MKLKAEILRDILTSNRKELPDRFESNYFFQSLNDCKKYIQELKLISRNFPKSNFKIIEVEFIKTINCHIGDNRLLSNFENEYTSMNFYKQAIDYLQNKHTSDPLKEIVFQGDYKITNIYYLLFSQKFYISFKPFKFGTFNG